MLRPGYRHAAFELDIGIARAFVKIKKGRLQLATALRTLTDSPTQVLLKQGAQPATGALGAGGLCKANQLGLSRQRLKYHPHSCQRLGANAAEKRYFTACKSDFRLPLLQYDDNWWPR
jgi:hypothetical protein